MKQALIVVSFGTTFPETRKLDIEAVENALQATFPKRDFYRAYTSRIIMKRLRENQGIVIHDLETTMQQLVDSGYEDVLIQTTHLTMGEEYSKKIMSVVHTFKGKFAKLAVGRPLLSDEFDYNLVAAALMSDLADVASDEAIVFMGHGSPNMHNPTYNLLEKRLHEKGVQAFIGVVEEDDHPNFEDMLEVLEASKLKKVLLLPLMLVCGDHASNDMAGEDEDSWLNMLTAKGYEVRTQMCGMGRNKAIQNIYAMHALAALAY